MYAKKLTFFLDKELGLKANRTSFSTRKLAPVYVQQGTLDRGIFVYVLNSCGLVKVVKKKYCQISPTQEQIKPVKENFSRKTCWSVQGFKMADQGAQQVESVRVLGGYLHTLTSTSQVNHTKCGN